MADRLILMVPDGADSLISILDLYMREWVSGTIFELRRNAMLFVN